MAEFCLWRNEKDIIVILFSVCIINVEVKEKKSNDSIHMHFTFWILLDFSIWIIEIFQNLNICILIR